MEIKFYEDTAGRVPVIEFLDSLDIKMRQKMLRSIQALQDMGISLRMPLSKVSNPHFKWGFIWNPSGVLY